MRNAISMKARFYFCLLLVLCLKPSFSQTALLANAGPDFTLCPGPGSILGSAVPASGGVPPYSFSWSPATGLSSTSVANPTVNVTTPTKYVLTVRDALDSIAYDTVFVDVSNISQYTAGNDTAYCYGLVPGAHLGTALNATAAGCTFSWLPTTGLNNPASPNPIANPLFTTTYTLTVTKGSCSFKSTVKVSIKVISLNLNTHDTTILEGNTITLISNSGASSYTWMPINNYIKYPNTATPDVNPLNTTTYTVQVTDGKGCYGTDTVIVRVIPSDVLFFYSAFTPNGDGDNDYFYIGNIQKYPNNILKVYNRYDQVIFTSAGYNNDWDGSYQGNQVPTGTYFYVLDTGSDKGKYKGTVTILR